jgi:hypothetical protein
MERLTSASEILDELGGNASVAKLTGSTSKAVWNWRAANSFPANTYVAITSALASKGKSAPPELWDMKCASEQVAS